MDEEHLIRRAKKGDLASFNHLVQQHQHQVYNLALRMLSEPAIAEDIAQETFLSAFRNLHTFHAGNFNAWLLRIAANAGRDYLRSAQVRRNISLEMLLDNPGFAPRASDEAPEDYTLRRELVGVIQHGLSTLSVDQRLALALVDIQGFGYEEAAQIVGIPVGTLKSRLSRARLAMRDQLLAQRELLPGEFRSR